VSAALIDQVVALASELGAARVEVARLEAELAALLGVDEAAAAAVVVQDRPLGKLVKALAATNRKVPKGERRRQVVGLWRDGVTDTAEIAKRLGITRKVAGIALWHARRDGDIPKAGASR
jgi:hypothetical protein